MPRDLRANESQKRAKARREHALSRRELGQPTSPRVPAAGPVSMAVKARNTFDDAMIEEFLRAKGTA